MAIEIPTAVTAADLRAADRLDRSWYAVPWRILQDVHGWALLAAGLVSLGAVLVLRDAHFDRDGLIGIAATLALAAAFFGASRAAREWRLQKKVRKLNASPSTATFAPVAINLRYPNGDRKHIRWGAYRSAVLDDRVLVLRLSGRKRVIHVFSLRHLLPGQHAELVDVLRQALGAAKVRVARGKGGGLRPDVHYVG